MRTLDWWRFAALLRLMRAGRGVGPSFAEIADAWGVRSKSRVSLGLDVLESEGLIERLPSRARAISVTKYLVPVRDAGGDMVVSGVLPE